MFCFHLPPPVLLPLRAKQPTDCYGVSEWMDGWLDGRLTALIPAASLCSYIFYILSCFHLFSSVTKALPGIAFCSWWPGWFFRKSLALWEICVFTLMVKDTSEKFSTTFTSGLVNIKPQKGTVERRNLWQDKPTIEGPLSRSHDPAKPEHARQCDILFYYFTAVI